MNNSKKILSYILTLLLGVVITYATLYISPTKFRGFMFRMEPMLEINENLPGLESQHSVTRNSSELKARSCGLSAKPTNLYKVAPTPGYHNKYEYYGFKLKSDCGSTNFSQLIFNITTKDLASSGSGLEDLYNFRIFENSSKVQNAEIIGIGMLPDTSNNKTVLLSGAPIASGLQKASGISKGIDDGTYKVIVKFNGTIPSGSEKTYSLRASLIGITTADTIRVELSPRENLFINNVDKLPIATFME